MTRRIRTLLAGLVLVLGVAPSAGAEPVEPLSPEIQALLPLLEAPDVSTRQSGFLQLEALRDPASADLVRGYAEHRDPDTRAFGVRALGAISGIAAVPVLVERLRQDRAPKVRLAALLALEPLRDPSAMPALIGALRDRHPHVRMAAVDVVSRMDEPDAKEAIRRRWRRERNRDVRRVLEQANARLDAPAS
jgi:HEAT repeat protein